MEKRTIMSLGWKRSFRTWGCAEIQARIFQTMPSPKDGSPRTSGQNDRSRRLNQGCRRRRPERRKALSQPAKAMGMRNTESRGLRRSFRGTYSRKGAGYRPAIRSPVDG